MQTEGFSPKFYRQLQQLRIRTRKLFLGSNEGMHRSLRKGHGLEFSDYRQYSPGDDFRHIDWGVLGRTDRIYVRQYREEKDINVIMFLDCSASMSFGKKFELAKKLMLALSFIGLSEGDTVTISGLGEKNSPHYRGLKAHSRIQAFLGGLDAKVKEGTLSNLRKSLARQKTPGKCFFISDFLSPLDEIITCFNYLRAKNFETVAIQILNPDELNLDLATQGTVIDSESGQEIELATDSASKKEYAHILANHIEKIESFCAKNSIAHLLISSEHSAEDVVLKAFTKLGVLR